MPATELTPEHLAELRLIASGEDWSPPQSEDVAALISEIDRLTAALAAAEGGMHNAIGGWDQEARSLEAALDQAARDLTKTRADRDNWQEIAVGRLHAAIESDRANQRYRLERERVDSIRVLAEQLRRLARFQLEAEPESPGWGTADVLGRQILVVMGTEMPYGTLAAAPQRPGAASVMDFPSEALQEPQRPAEGFAALPMPGCGHAGTWMIVDESGIVCMVCGPAKAEEIAPEDEGISSADVQAQIAEDQYMNTTTDCPECDAYGRTRDEHGLTAQPCPRCAGTGRIPHGESNPK